MARRPKSRTRRKSGGGTMRRVLQVGAMLVLAGACYAAWFWYSMQSWRPDPASFPEQGAVIASGSPSVRFETLKAIGADFVYLELEPAGVEPDPDFGEKLAAAKEAGLAVGVVQPFDPCLDASAHSARFTRMVPREDDLLPPALSLIRLPENCERPVTSAAVTSEVITLVNQVEAHSGSQMILKLGEDFEESYGLAMRFDRDIWLVRDRSQPRYAGRPWLLWSANSQLETEAVAQPIEWVVVQR